MRRLLYCMLFIFSSCSLSAMNIQDTDNIKRAKMCKERCNKKHIPDIKFIRINGKVETYKINVISIEDKVACECVF